MTQARSRWLGRTLLAVAGLQFVGAARALRGCPWFVALPLLVVTGAVSALLAWAGVTLAVMNWDDPADYPPSEDASRSQP